MVNNDMDLHDLKLSELEPDEALALRKYKTAECDENGVSKCFDLNRELRNGIFVSELSDPLREVANSLDAVFSRCPKLTDSLTVYRGTSFCKTLPITEINKRFRSLEFWSTALSEGPIESFLKGGKNAAILELRLSSGCAPYNLETLPNIGESEEELLLPRGILWRVKDCKKSEISDFLKNTGVETLCRAVLEVEEWPRFS